MRKKVFIYGLGFVSIATLIIVAGNEIIETNQIVQEPVKQVDFEDEFDFYDNLVKDDEIKYIDNEYEVIKNDNIKTTWYVAEIKKDDNIDVIIIRLMGNPQTMNNGDITYYYSDVFNNENIVYSSTYMKDTNEFLNNSGPSIIGVQDLSIILKELNMEKDEYTKKELYEILRTIKEEYSIKKLSEHNAMVKAYNH